MTIKNLSDALIYLGAVAGALAAIGAVLRYVAVRPLKHWMVEQIQPVRAEMSPDHGRSVKDVVDRTELKVDALSARLDDHIAHHPGS